MLLKLCVKSSASISLLTSCTRTQQQEMTVILNIRRVVLWSANPRLMTVRRISARLFQLLPHNGRSQVSLPACCFMKESYFCQRSPSSGLYSKLQEYSLPYPEAIFDLSYFLREPHAFLRLSKELLPGKHLPNPAHYFLRLLNDKGILLRLYTQNIDGLEREAGIPAEKLVEAHGTFSSATCTMCLKEYPGKTFQDAVMESQVPHCSSCGGIIKPDIVFFGEQLPARFFLHLMDFPMADLLIVMGTSLEVEPFASLVYAISRSTPRVLINRDNVGPFLNTSDGLNVVELGGVTSGVKHFVQLLGWESELEKLEKSGKNNDSTEDLQA